MNRYHAIVNLYVKYSNLKTIFSIYIGKLSWDSPISLIMNTIMLFKTIKLKIVLSEGDFIILIHFHCLREYSNYHFLCKIVYSAIYTGFLSFIQLNVMKQILVLFFVLSSFLLLYEILEVINWNFILTQEGFWSMSDWPHSFGPMTGEHIMVAERHRVKVLTSWPGSKREK